MIPPGHSLSPEAYRGPSHLAGCPPPPPWGSEAFSSSVGAGACNQEGCFSLGCFPRLNGEVALFLKPLVAVRLTQKALVLWDQRRINTASFAPSSLLCFYAIANPVLPLRLSGQLGS